METKRDHSRSRQRLFLALLCAVAFVPSACAWFPRESGFDDVKQMAEERGGLEAHWEQGTEDDTRMRELVRSLLGQELTAESAAHIALLNNRRMQAIYQTLGIAQSEVIEAGLLPNPVADLLYKGTTEGMREPELEIGVTMGFVDVLTLPLRRQIAKDRFEAAKLEVTQQILALAAETRAQFYIVQADEQMRELLRHIVEATESSLEVARRLHEAGNTRQLDLDNEAVLNAEARLDLAAAELDARKHRERLNILMGLWGEDVGVKISSRLPETPTEEIALDEIEKRVIAANLDLAILRHRLTASGRVLGISRVTALIPELEVGGEMTREPDGNRLWGVGGSMPIPIFNQGQPHVARAKAELQRTQDEFYHKAVETRAAARAARDHLQLARDRAIYTRDVLLPLQTRILNETQLEYNAMQIGVFHLLAAKRAEIAAGKRYVGDLRDYWLARTEMESLLSGHVTAVGFETTVLDSTMGSALH